MHQPTLIAPLMLATLILTAGSPAQTPVAEASTEKQLAEKARIEKALIEKARAIHAATLTIDTHKDINPTLALDSSSKDPEEQRKWRERNDPTVRGSNQVDFPKMREGGYGCAFYIVYTGQGRLDGGGYIKAKKEAMLKFKAIQRMVDKYPQHIGLARTPAEVRKLHASGRLVACIGIENGYPMGTDLGRIEEFYNLGARYMGIAHTGHNQLGDAHTPPEPLHDGLSELGRKAIAEMNRLGIMIDISHSSKQTMLQAAALSKAPVLASHSGCMAIRKHTRNLDDEQLAALAKKGGVIQCVALGNFVKDDSGRRDAMDALREAMHVPSRRQLWRMSEKGIPEDVQKKLDQFEARVKKEIDPKFGPANVKDFVDHIDHAVQLIGIDHVAISSDFDGGGGLEGWNNAAETFNVTLELVRRGYTKEQIAKLWSGNTLRLWAEVERVAKELRSADK